MPPTMARNIGFDVNPRGSRLVVVQLAFLFAAWMASILRAYVKIFMLKKVTVDDWSMLIGLFLYTAYGVIAAHGVVTGGTGRHTNELTSEGISIALRAWYLCEVLYVPIELFIRTSIALFLHRLAAESWQIWVIRMNIGVLWAMSIAYFFIMIFQCTPPSYFWAYPAGIVPESAGSCIAHDIVPVMTLVHSILSAISDWMLGLLPIIILWNVRINRKTKISIAIFLGLGLIAGIALMIRVPYLKKIAISADFLFETIDVAIWSVLEPSLGILAGCIATLKPLVRSWGFGLNRSSKGEGPRGQYQSAGSRHWRRSYHQKMCKIDVAADESHKFDMKSSQIELRQASHASNELSPSPWDIERCYESEMGALDGITVQTKIDVTSFRRPSVDARKPISSGSPSPAHRCRSTTGLSI